MSEKVLRSGRRRVTPQEGAEQHMTTPAPEARPLAELTGLRDALRAARELDVFKHSPENDAAWAAVDKAWGALLKALSEDRSQP